jgi:hypothetical protein
MDYRAHPKFDAFTNALEVDRGLPTGTLKALVGSESAGRAKARSPVGAQGLTQFMPATAKQYNVDVANPWDSLRGTADYLSDLAKKYDGNIDAALSHYNGGAHNANYFVDGTAPSRDKVSPKNHQVNKGYVAKISGQIGKAASGPTAGQVGDFIAQLANSGQSPVEIVEQLSKSAALSNIVGVAEKKGYSPEEIVNRMGGDAYAKILKTRSDVDKRGAVMNAVEGAGYAAADLGRGVSQIASRVTSDDKGLVLKQARQAALESDPRRRTVMDSTAGTVGNVGAKVIPSVVAAVATGGTSIPIQAAAQGGMGVLQGAFTPTTDKGQILSNIVIGGGAGAVGGGLGAVAARAPSVLLRSAQKGMRGGQSVDEVTARLATREAAGIRSSAADLSPNLNAAADKIGDGVMGSRMLGADKRALREPEIARAITARIGNESDELSAAVVKKAQDNVSKLYDDALDGVSLQLPPTFGTTMDDIVAGHAASTIPSLSSRLPATVASDLKALASQGPVTARQLQSIRSKIGAEMGSGSDPAAKQSLGQIRDAVDDALRASLPDENLAKFTKANELYKNLQVAENYGRRTNWSGDDFSAKKFMTSIKAENKAGFERGDAPFQDLVGAIAGGEGAGVRYGALNPLQVTNLAGGLATGGTSLIGSGIAGNLALRILTDPKYANILLGLNPVQRAGLMQAAAAARVGAVATGSQVAQPAPAR